MIKWGHQYSFFCPWSTSWTICSANWEQKDHMIIPIYRFLKMKLFSSSTELSENGNHFSFLRHLCVLWKLIIFFLNKFYLGISKDSIGTGMHSDLNRQFYLRIKQETILPNLAKFCVCMSVCECMCMYLVTVTSNPALMSRTETNQVLYEKCTKRHLLYIFLQESPGCDGEQCGWTL